MNQYELRSIKINQDHSRLTKIIKNHSRSTKIDKKQLPDFTTVKNKDIFSDVGYQHKITKVF